MGNKWHGGKGDRSRPMSVDQKQFSDNWDKIFGNKDKKEPKTKENPK